MSLLRLNDFVPGTTIFSGQVDAELNQLIEALNGVSSDKDIIMRLNHASNAVLTLNQLGVGPILKGQQNGVDRFFLSVLGKLSLPAGVGATPSSDFISNFGTYFVDPSTRSTPANTNETDLSSKTLSANVLANNGDFLLGVTAFNTGSNANTKRYRLYFAGSAFFDTGASAANGATVFVIFYILRTGSASASIFTMYMSNNMALLPGSPASVQAALPGALDFTITNILKSTGQNGAATAGDLNQFGFILLKGSV